MMFIRKEKEQSLLDEKERNSEQINVFGTT